MRLRQRFARRLFACVVLGFCIVTPPSYGAGGEQGTLRIKGPGSVYAGGVSYGAGEPLVTQAVAAGSAATYSFQVKNTGNAVAQYNIFTVVGSHCQHGCADPVIAITAGSLAVTPLAQSQGGYFTAPINPGAVMTYTLKVTPSQTGTPGDYYYADIELRDTSGQTMLGIARTMTYIKQAAGNTASDQFVGSSGVTATSSLNDQFIVASPTVNVGQTATWTVKIANNTAGTHAIHYTVGEIRCGIYYALTVKEGLTDVTSRVQSGNYYKALAAGKSVTLNVSAKVLRDPRICLASSKYAFNYWQSSSSDDVGGYHYAYLVLNMPAA